MALLLLAAGAEFTIRGPLRAVRFADSWNDFLSPYVQSRAWLQGLDPYSLSAFQAAWPGDLRKPDFVADPTSEETLIARHGVPSPYPLTTFVVLTPLCLLPWSVARLAWIALTLAVFALSLAALISLAGMNWKRPRAQLFVALALALAPFHTGIATENPAILAVGLALISLWAADRSRNILAGVLLALSACLKPQVGLWFVLYYFVRRRWTIAAIAVVSSAVVALIAVLRLVHVSWLASYIRDTRSIFAPGAINDFTPLNPVWYNMVDLRGPVWQLLGNRSAASVVPLLVGLLLFAIWLWLMIKRQPSSFLGISALAVLSLLPVYHRFYDAALLILPLAWSVMIAGEQHKRIAAVTVICILPFLVPGAALLDYCVRMGRVSAAISHGWWWNVIVMPHAVWAISVLSLILLTAMARTCSEPNLPIEQVD